MPMFFWGVIGSLLIELVTMLEFYNTDKALPSRYKKPGFIVIRLLLAVGAGGLVSAYKINDNALLAINVGASAPVLIRALGQGIKGAS